MIKKLLCMVLILGMSINLSFGADKWMEGTGADVYSGGDSTSDLDTLLAASSTNPLDRLLDGYLTGCTITVTDDEVLTVSIGQVVCQNAAGAHRFRENTATATVDNTAADVGGLDTGSVAADTWYAVYAVADADATTFTLILSTSFTNPTNAAALYYKLIGVALTDATSDWLPYYWSGNGHDVTIMWDVPLEETTTLSNGSWTSLDLTSAMPSVSTLAILGLYAQGPSTGAIWVRPNGSTLTTNFDNALYNNSGEIVGGQRFCMTDSSQVIEYQTIAATTGTRVSVEGFIFNR